MGFSVIICPALTSFTCPSLSSPPWYLLPLPLVPVFLCFLPITEDSRFLFWLGLLPPPQHFRCFFLVLTFCCKPYQLLFFVILNVLSSRLCIWVCLLSCINKHDRRCLCERSRPDAGKKIIFQAKHITNNLFCCLPYANLPHQHTAYGFSEVAAETNTPELYLDLFLEGTEFLVMQSRSFFGDL